MAVRAWTPNRRIAIISVHTSPLAQPGSGDAGGMNVYVWQTARRLVERGAAVEIFTRATSSRDEPIVHVEPGLTVHHVQAGPFEGLDKADLPAQLCAFAAAVLRAEARQEPGYYDLIHSHYWLSGQVGWLARDRWKVPLVHTAHTLGAVKNAALAVGDVPEPAVRIVGEQQVVDEADRLIANTVAEAQELRRYYQADPATIDIATPGVDLDTYRPGDRVAARGTHGWGPEEFIIGFVGRIQPLKGPDVLLRAAAPLLRETATPTRVVIVGGPSGAGMKQPTQLIDMAHELGIADRVTFLPPQHPRDLAEIYRAVDVVAVPSYSESFGLVALEAQACGTPVVAAHVGGLGVAVADGRSGFLVEGHEPQEWARYLRRLRDDRALRAELARGALAHAPRFSWDVTVDALERSYQIAATDYRRAQRSLAGRTFAGRAFDGRGFDGRGGWTRKLRA